LRKRILAFARIVYLSQLRPARWTPATSIGGELLEFTSKSEGGWESPPKKNSGEGGMDSLRSSGHVRRPLGSVRGHEPLKSRAVGLMGINEAARFESLLR
jgi:hypothetical protein